MATFTITGTQNIDALTGKTGGDIYNINGGTLVIDQDSRSWLNNSTTSSMAGIAISATLGGKIIIDTSKVREIPFDTGAGVVPAFNTLITQWSASGKLIAVYSTLNSWPIVSGAAMPATWFIKVKDWNSVAYTTWALTGISANATSADKQWWIELVADQAQTTTLVRLWSFEWNKDNPNLLYEIGTTSGVAGQILNTPTFWGANSFIPTVWIEDWLWWLEKWTGMYSTVFSSTNFWTDWRSKVFHTITNWQIRFGNDWTTNVWAVPTAWRKVYIPTVILRQTSSANRAVNLLPSTTITSRPEFATTGGWVIIFNSHIWDWYFNFAQAYSISMRNFAYFDSMVVSNSGSKPDCRNFWCWVSLLAAAATAYPILDTLNSFWSNFEDYNVMRTGTAWSSIVSYCTGTIWPVHKNAVIWFATFSRPSNNYWFYATQCPDLVIENVQTTNCNVVLATCVNFNISWHDYIDRYVWTTASTPTAIYQFVTTTSCDQWVYEDFTIGTNNTYPNVHSYNGIYNPQYSSNIILKNGGTPTSTLWWATNAMAYLLADSWNNDNIKLQRIYLTATRVAPQLWSAASKNIVFENCVATAWTLWLWQSTSLIKWMRATTLSISWQPACYWTHRYNTFTNDTTWIITVAMNEATIDTASQVELVSLWATSWFTSTWILAIPTLWDQIIWTTPYYIKWYTAFANLALTITWVNTGNYSYEYDLDINDGNGFTGTWRTADWPTLSAESINPVDWFKLKLRVTTTTASVTNSLTYIRINMVTTATAQRELYPLTISNRIYELTWLAIWTEVVMFDSSDNEIDREVITWTTYSYTYEWNSDIWDTMWHCLIWKNNKQVIKLDVDYINENQTVPISQQDDLVYDSWFVAVSTIDYANKLQILTTQNVSIPYLYSQRKYDILQTNNSQYDFAYDIVWGNIVVGATSIPDYVFQKNWRKIRPIESNWATNMTNWIIVAETGDPFVNTLWSYTVRINYQNPVQAITVNTSGWTLTAEQVRIEIDDNSTKLQWIITNTNLIPATI